MTATNDPAPASPGEPAKAQFGPHRFSAGEGGGSEQYRRARFDVADLRGTRFTDCDMTGVTIRDCWLVNVSISGYLSNVTVNGVVRTTATGKNAIEGLCCASTRPRKPGVIFRSGAVRR